jgi:uncharacterized membrane protein YphA (DoxX/SURF4 family)
VLQRLFSTFPGGRPGAALLLLRVTVGVTSAVEGVLYLTSGSKWAFDVLLPCVLLVLGGAFLLIGLATPFASALVGLAGIGIAVLWVPAPHGDLFDGKLGFLPMIAVVGAIALLGPGAFSIDAYLFGRHEIVIPASSRSAQS